MPMGHFSQVPSILPPSGFSIQAEHKMEPATGIMGKTTMAEQWTPESGQERGRQCGAEEGVHVVSVSAHLQLAGERFTEIVASPYYMLPEALKHNYGSEIDVWIDTLHTSLWCANIFGRCLLSLIGQNICCEEIINHLTNCPRRRLDSLAAA